MKPGPKPSTLRGRAAGGTEIRAWVSTEEARIIEANARRAGLSVPDYVRACALAENPK